MAKPLTPRMCALLIALREEGATLELLPPIQITGECGDTYRVRGGRKGYDGYRPGGFNIATVTVNALHQRKLIEASPDYVTCHFRLSQTGREAAATINPKEHRNG